MTALGAFWVLMGLITLSWGMIERSNRKLGLLVLIFVLHLVTTLVYYRYVQANDADTKLYYYDPYKFYGDRFSLGTVFLIYLVQWLRGLIGGSYFDYFLLFQLFGLAGIMVLVRTLEELTQILRSTWPPVFTVMVLMPGIYFWTSAIGKDAPLFLASSLAIWAGLQFARRWLWFGLALVLMVLFRPHVALVAAAALALAVVLGRGISPAVRTAAIAFAVICTGFIAQTVQSSLQIDLTSVGSIASYVENQTAVASGASGDNALAGMSYPLKLLSLLYRPLFVDAGGLFGLVASFQNLFMLFASFVMLRQFGTWRAMFRASLGIRFATVYLIGMILLLTVMYYNVGLGLRQREMFTPALFVIFGALYCHARLRAGIGQIVPASQSVDPAAAMPAQAAKA
jgi:hypothetical protein